MAEGVVVSFYSYKGGVGRTFALANIATTLAIWGYRVLCVDWDLEAPGLSNYFGRWLEQPHHGLLDLVEDIAAGHPIGQRQLTNIVRVPSCGDRLALIPAGRQDDDDYVRRVQDIDWTALYEEHGFGTILEDIRGQWTGGYDFVLVDSRTGITDIGGICTVQLPDILVFMFTANHQSLHGAMQVARRATAARSQLPYDRSRLLALPVPCRFESGDEYQLAVQWQQTFVEELKPFYGNWAVRENTAKQLIERTTIPYFAYWSFGEQLPVVDELTRAPGYISYHFETLAALLAHRLTKSDLLVESRDSYVSAAAREGLRGGGYAYDVFVSYSQEDKQTGKIAEELTDLLSSSDVRVFLDRREIGPGSDWPDALDRALSGSRHMVAVIGRSLGRSQDLELNKFMKQTLDEGSERTVFPVLVGVSFTSLPPLLRQTQALSINVDDPTAKVDLQRLAIEIADAVHRESRTLGDRPGAAQVSPADQAQADEIASMDAYDAADSLLNLPPSQAAHILSLMNPENSGKALGKLHDYDAASEILPLLESDTLAKMLDGLGPWDETARILEALAARLAGATLSKMLWSSSVLTKMEPESAAAVIDQMTPQELDKTLSINGSISPDPLDDLIDYISKDRGLYLMTRIRPSRAAKLLENMVQRNPERADELIREMRPGVAGRIFDEMDIDAALGWITRIDSTAAARLLETMPPKKAAILLNRIEPIHAQDLLILIKPERAFHVRKSMEKLEED